MLSNIEWTRFLTDRHKVTDGQSDSYGENNVFPEVGHKICQPKQKTNVANAYASKWICTLSTSPALKAFGTRESVKTIDAPRKRAIMECVSR